MPTHTHVVSPSDDAIDTHDSFLSTARAKAKAMATKKKGLAKKRLAEKRERESVATTPTTPLRPIDLQAHQGYVMHVDTVSVPSNNDLQLVITKVVTPGSSNTCNDCCSDTPKTPNTPPLPSVASVDITIDQPPSQQTSDTSSELNGIASCAVLGKFVFCGMSDGKVVAYPLEGDDTAKGTKMCIAPPSALQNQGAARHVAVADCDRNEYLPLGICVVYDSGAFAKFKFLDENNSYTPINFSAPHSTFADTNKGQVNRQRSRWHTNARHTIGGALLTKDGKTLFIASPVLREHVVYKWNLPIGKQSEDSFGDLNDELKFGTLERLEKHVDKVTCLAFYGNGLVTGGNDKQLVAWRARGESPRALKEETLKIGPETLTSVSETLSKPSLVSARSVKAPGGAIRALTVSADCDSIYTAGSDGAVRAWDVSDVFGVKGFVLLRTFLGGHDGFCVSICLLNDQFVVSGSEANPGGFWVKGDGAVKVWRIASGKCVATKCAMDQKGDIVAIISSWAGVNNDSHSTKNTSMLTASKDGKVAHWKVDASKSISNVSNFSERKRNTDADGGVVSLTWSKGFFD